MMAAVGGAPSAAVVLPASRPTTIASTTVMIIMELPSTGVAPRS